MGINMAARVHFVSAIENAVEADRSLSSPLRDKPIHPPIRVSDDEAFSACEKPGIGIEVERDMIRHYAGVEGPRYV
jgi:L-alanine-DL-glutamate epimerase-like enolase superfamily enzyme